MESEGAEGEAESDVVEGVWFRGGGDLCVGDGDFDLLGHDVVLSHMHREQLRLSNKTTVQMFEQEESCVDDGVWKCGSLDGLDYGSLELRKRSLRKSALNCLRAATTLYCLLIVLYLCP